jgi:orotidine-5'-phosphate decarboxylase
MPTAEKITPINAKDRIIVALDVDTEASARKLIEELADVVGAFKIGLQLFTAAGPQFVRDVTSKGHRVFLDLKFHDIPNTVSLAAVEAARLGVWMFNVHALGGSEMMRSCVDNVEQVCSREGIERPKIIAVTILTSSDANELGEVGIERDVEKEVVTLAQLTAKCGLDGVVASSREAALVKTAVKQPFFVVTPGIRPSSETNDDQKRVNTPAAAVQTGSDLLVIGRPITAAANKREAAIAIANEIATSTIQIPD